MAWSNGARLNQTKKVIKKAAQLRCNIFIFPEKDSRLKRSVDMCIRYPKLIENKLLES